MWRLNYSVRHPSDSPDALSFTMQREVGLGGKNTNKKKKIKGTERNGRDRKALKAQEYVKHMFPERNLYNQTARRVCATFDTQKMEKMPKRSTADEERPRGLNSGRPMKGVIFLGTIPTPGDLSTDDQLWPALCEPISY